MKKYIIALCCAGLAFAGCKKAKSVADVNVDIPYGEHVVIPDLGLPPGPLPLGIPGVQIPLPGMTFGYSFATNVNTYLALYNTSIDKVNSATLKTIGFRLLGGQGANFNFLDTMRVYMSSTNQPRILAGYRYGVPKGVDTFALTVTDQNLKSYFTQDSIFVSLEGYINAVPPQNDSVAVGSIFHLYANPLN